jgi:hypothetical protein
VNKKEAKKTLIPRWGAACAAVLKVVLVSRMAVIFEHRSAENRA